MLFRKPGTLCPVLLPLSLLLGAWTMGRLALACLSLQENAIGDEGMGALSTALKFNTTLAHLQ